MYAWIGQRPYKHHKTFRAWYRTIEGAKEYQDFATEPEALAFIAKASALVVKDGRPIEDVINAYLATLHQLRQSSRTTLRYRLQAITTGRQRVPIEAFPWLQAWKDQVVPQSGDSQRGILAALQGLVSYAKLRGNPLEGLEPTKPKNEGKPQLRVTEAQRFIAMAVSEGDSLALAAATIAVTGLRPGEVMALKARDCDDGGALLWVEKGKTRAAKREIEVEEAFRPMLLAMTKGKAAGDLLFDYTPAPKGRPCSTNITKARTDALLRRVRSLCEAAGVPGVVTHSLRGLNATLRKLGGGTDASVTNALGQLNFSTTRRHYLAPGTAEKMDGRRAHGRLLLTKAA